MDLIEILLDAILFVLLLLLSAFFSGSEVAIFGLSRKDRDDVLKDERPLTSYLRKLIERPHHTLITILTADTLVNISAASIAAILTTKICAFYHLVTSWGILFEVFLVTLIILIFGEITPKIIALRNPLKTARKIALPLTWIKIIFSPLVALLSALTDSMVKILGLQKYRLIYTTEELKTLVEVSEEKGQLEESEREMISSIFTFGDTLVKEIMVPRTDVSMVDVETPIDELIDFIKASGYTRYPVYRESRDEIIGFLYAKDLLRFLSEDKRQFNLQSILRDPYFVPENKEISALLKEFQKNKIHAAVVVDEYGGTAGLVTLEDILEEIVGEIQDEYDEESPLFTRISPNIIIADAKLPIDKINELLETTLLPENGDFETLGGFIYDHTGRIPEVNEAFEFKNFKFTVVEVEGQRLKKIRIEEMNV